PRPLYEADRLLEILHLRPSMGEEDGAQDEASDERGQIGEGQESHRIPTTPYHPRQKKLSDDNEGPGGQIDRSRSSAMSDRPMSSRLFVCPASSSMMRH